MSLVLTNAFAYGSSSPPPSSTLAGVGSTSTSLVDYPRGSAVATGDYYVDASVTSSGAGTTLATAFKTIPEGLAALSAGETLVVKGGTYTLPSGGLVRNTNWASETRVVAYVNDRPILNAASVGANASAIKFESSANNETWHGFHVKNVPDNGAGIDGQAIRGAGASNIKLSSMWVSHCRNDGIWFYECDDIRVLDCAVWRLGDGVLVDTDAPDGIVATGGSGTPSTNVVVARCFVANAPDDGTDFFRAINSTVVDCVVYDCGRYWNGSTGGDGNGFKLGGDSDGNDNTIRGSLALDNRNNGIDGNLGDSINYYRNTSVGNGGLGFDCNGDNAAEDGVANDNIALSNSGGNEYVGSFVTDSFNTWNLSITNASFADAAGGDYSLGTGSACIGAGISGGNLGASDVALEVALEWLAKDLT